LTRSLSACPHGAEQIQLKIAANENISRSTELF
jgi:hypothetical protein